MKHSIDHKEYLQKAQQGDALAQKRLGLLLTQSDQTLDEGIHWLTQAARQDSDAMYLLGRLFLKKKNAPAQAFRWYEKAAEAGHIDAMVGMGAFYLYGFSVPQSVENAVAWYKKAALAHSPAAIHNLGFLCYQDPQLRNTALNYFLQAEQLGYADSAYMLGVMYLQGAGTEKDPMKALSHLEKAVALGKHFACRPIGDLYFQGAFDMGKQNPDKAIDWYQKGMSYGILSCIEVLGDCYYHSFGVDEDLDLAFDLYSAAAAKGSMDAAFILGTMYIRGEARKKDLQEALKWMHLAQIRGHQKAPEFIRMLHEALSRTGAAASAGAGGGVSVGVRLRNSYSAEAEAIKMEKRARLEEYKTKNAGIFAAAGTLSGKGAQVDYELGAVINDDGEVSYVDPEAGVILGADGSVSTHDTATGFTYNWTTGKTLAYDETLNATMDLDTGKVRYHKNGSTSK